MPSPTSRATNSGASAAAGSSNNFNVDNVAPLNYAQGENLTTKVYHGVSITAGSFNAGTIIGRIQSWQPDSYTREGVHLYELADLSWGRPVEYVPGKATGFTVAVTRAEVWDAEMEKAFGFGFLFNDLVDQSFPFQMREFWIQGDKGTKQIWEYRGCWFQNKNIDAITSDGDGITRISATIAYVSRRLTSK
jgi:hypothetical protein